MESANSHNERQDATQDTIETIMRSIEETTRRLQDTNQEFIWNAALRCLAPELQKLAIDLPIETKMELLDLAI